MKQSAYRRVVDGFDGSISPDTLSRVRPALVPEKPLQDRRRARRIPAESAVVMLQLQAQVVDVSKDGMRLHVSHPLKPGTVIQVQVKDTTALCEVRYCKEVDGATCVGVKVQRML
jgi:hypothetical protein